MGATTPAPGSPPAPGPAPGPAPAPAAARAGRRRSRVGLALFLLGGLLLALELVVRLGGFVDVARGTSTEHQAAFNAADLFVASDDPSLSYTNRPLASATIDGIEYRHDAHGWRVLPADAGAGDSEGAGAAAGAGADAGTDAGSGAGHDAGAAGVRPVVAFFGDSTTYGLGLPAGDSLPALVAQALGGTIVPRNLGTCGYGTAQAAALYAAQRAELAGAEVIVLVFFPNDFARGTFLWDSGLDAMYVDPLPVPFALKGVLWRSALYRALVSELAASDAVREAFDAANPENQALALQEVARFAALVRADGKRLLVAHLPAMERLDPYLFEGPVARLAQSCAERGVPFVDLLPAFLAERERLISDYEARGGATVTAEQRSHFLARYWISSPRDHHLDAAANRIAAAALASALAELLPER